MSPALQNRPFRLPSEGCHSPASPSRARMPPSRHGLPDGGTRAQARYDPAARAFLGEHHAFKRACLSEHRRGSTHRRIQAAGGEFQHHHDLFPPQMMPFHDFVHSGPNSRFSNSRETGIRVSLKTHAPLTLPGTLSTAGHWDQSRAAMVGLLTSLSFQGKGSAGSCHAFQGL